MSTGADIGTVTTTSRGAGALGLGAADVVALGAADDDEVGVGAARGAGVVGVVRDVDCVAGVMGRGDDGDVVVAEVGASVVVVVGAADVVVVVGAVVGVAVVVGAVGVAVVVGGVVARGDDCGVVVADAGVGAADVVGAALGAVVVGAGGAGAACGTAIVGGITGPSAALPPAVPCSVARSSDPSSACAALSTDSRIGAGSASAA
jgi:hypothetical protein